MGWKYSGTSGTGITSSATAATSRSPSLQTAMTGPRRALISCMFDMTLSKTLPRGTRNTLGRVLVHQRDRPVLHLGGRIALGVDVADFLELERPSSAAG